MKKIFKKILKFAGIIAILLIGILVVCGVPLNEMKENLKNKLYE